MKAISLEESIRRAAAFNRDNPDIPRLRSGHPVCGRCNKEIDCCEIVNVNNKGCEIRAICDHGTGVDEEDFYKVTWPALPRHDAADVDILEDKNVGWAIKRAMGDALFFMPKHQWDFSSKR